MIKNLVSAMSNHLNLYVLYVQYLFFYDLCFLELKKPIENLKSLKLESLHLSWKELIEVGKFLMQYSITKYFSTLARIFQLYFSQFYFELSNLIVSNFSFKKTLLFLTVENFWVLEKSFIKRLRRAL